ncbi:hypothetical protein RRG08_053124 [Elysia crispata]|uniref:Uncharacterized protein n=1 Tax=Elysia crispata TaxID=231223 RepID=A0AAE1AIV4_9GAST|nr:hypothetical protein RRG08_053124 [Elysia crispata]
MREVQRFNLHNGSANTTECERSTSFPYLQVAEWIMLAKYKQDLDLGESVSTNGFPRDLSTPLRDNDPRAKELEIKLEQTLRQLVLPKGILVLRTI